MASREQEPLLSSPTPPSRRTCKALLLSLPLAAIIGFGLLYSLQPPPTISNLQPSQLCIDSPNPTSCHTLVSDALLSTPRLSTAAVFHTMLQNSLLQLRSAVAAANSADQTPAITDCLHLLDLSRDHLAAAASHSDARTWLSAALTNHVTCLDGLEAGPARAAMEGPLRSLMALASASLAVLNSISPAASSTIQPTVSFPSWLTHRDRKLLEAPVGAVAADAVVAQDGSGKYKTVQQAVDAAPSKSAKRYVIYVKKGVYKETVRMDKSKTNVMIVGDGMDATIISGSLNNVDGITTFNSATLAAVGTGLILQDLRIENTAGAAKHQAVALRVGADQAVINRCRLDGYQDTLYTHSLRQFFRDCSISGTVDFIFGNAAVVFQNCNIVVRNPLSNQKNTVTAQGRTDPNQNTGTSIQSCKVTGAPDLAPATLSYLGRPWKLYSNTVFMQSNIGSLIAPKGWLEWDGDFALKTLYYGEYLNTGAGAGTAGRVTWPGFEVIKDAGKAKAYTVASLIQGSVWLKSTGVAFTEGL